jgi:hypothetical protein
MASWYCFDAPFAVASRSGLADPERLAALARFLQCVYMRRSCVKSCVHHLFAYGDGLALGVSACTASSTAAISLSVLCCVVPSGRLALSALKILSLIAFHSAFLSRSRSCCCVAGTGLLKTVSIVLWSEPCSVADLHFQKRCTLTCS